MLNLDTSQLEKEAESYVCSRLANAELLVAKPMFGHLGTDLLAFAEMKDSLKFCRIQCKGRSFKTSNNTNITISASYVTDAFIVFLYISEPNSEPFLCIFFPSEIRKWTLVTDKYQLNISKNSYREKLSPFQVNGLKMNTVKKVIEAANVTGEFKQMIVSEISFKVHSPKFSVQASTSPRKQDA